MFRASFEKLNKNPVVYFLFLTITSTIFLFGAREIDKNTRDRDFEKRLESLEEKNSKLQNKIDSLSGALIECMTQNAYSKELEKLKHTR